MSFENVFHSPLFRLQAAASNPTGQAPDRRRFLGLGQIAPLQVAPPPLVELLLDPELRLRYGRAAREVAESYDWAEIAKQMLALYQECIAHFREKVTTRADSANGHSSASAAPPLPNPGGSSTVSPPGLGG